MGIGVIVDDGVAVNVGGMGVWVAVDVGVKIAVGGASVCGVRQPATSSADTIHTAIHLCMDGLYTATEGRTFVRPSV